MQEDEEIIHNQETKRLYKLIEVEKEAAKTELIDKLVAENVATKEAIETAITAVKPEEQIEPDAPIEDEPVIPEDPIEPEQEE